jgi:hypothetical protein
MPDIVVGKEQFVKERALLIHDWRGGWTGTSKKREKWSKLPGDSDSGEKNQNHRREPAIFHEKKGAWCALMNIRRSNREWLYSI